MINVRGLVLEMLGLFVLSGALLLAACWAALQLPTELWQGAAIGFYMAHHRDLTLTIWRRALGRSE